MAAINELKESESEYFNASELNAHLNSKSHDKALRQPRVRLSSEVKISPSIDEIEFPLSLKLK